MIKYFLIFAVALSLIILPGFTQTKLVDKIACVINKRVVTLFELNQMLERYAKKNPDLESKIKTEEGRKKEQKRLLDLIIEEEVIRAELSKLKREVTDNEITDAINGIKKQNNLTDEEFRAALFKEEGRSYDEYFKDIRLQLEKFRIMNLAIKPMVSVSKQEIDEVYKASYENKTGDISVKLQIIFFGTLSLSKEDKEKKRVQTDGILARAKKGEDFQHLVSNYSEAGESDTGYLPLKNLNSSFKNALSKMKVGDISDILELENGFYIIKYADQSTEKAPDLKKIESVITEKISRKKMEDKFVQWLQDSRKKAFVDIKI